MDGFWSDFFRRISPKTGNGELPKETKNDERRLLKFALISFVLFRSFRPSLASVLRLA